MNKGAGILGEEGVELLGSQKLVGAFGEFEVEFFEEVKETGVCAVGGDGEEVAAGTKDAEGFGGELGGIGHVFEYVDAVDGVVGGGGDGQVLCVGDEPVNVGVRTVGGEHFAGEIAGGAVGGVELVEQRGRACADF